MNIIKKYLYKRAMSVAKRTGYIMQEIVLMRYDAILPLSKKWSASEYEKLESARLLAKSKDHWFEELQILLDEVSLLLEKHHDKQLYYAVNQRLKEMHDIFSLDHSVFAEKFKANYLCFSDPNILNQTYECLKVFHNCFYERADFMLAHLQYDTAILCGKAICQIASLSDVVSFEDHIETLFQIAIAYGNRREFYKAIEYYDMALDLARDADDTTYEYICVIRKSTVCIAAIDLTVYADVDSGRLSVAKDLVALCSKYNLNPYELGEKLLEEETSEFRKDRLKEAMPFLDNLMALQRGDWQTASQSTKEMKDAEAKAYGGSKDQYSNSDLLSIVYKTLYNSAAREDTEADAETSSQDKDTIYSLPFLDNLFYADQIKWLLLFSKAEIQNGHPKCAGHLAEEARNITEKVYSDYYTAIAIHSLGQVYEGSGDTENAVKLYEEVVSMFSNPQHEGSDITMSVQLLYSTLYELGNLMKNSKPEYAIQMLSNALDKAGGSADADKDFFRLNILICRAKAYRNLGLSSHSEADLSEAISLIISQSSRRLPYMDGDLRENYWMETSKFINNTMLLIDEQSSASLRKKAYELVLYAKGILLSSERAVKNVVYSDGTPADVRKLYEDLEQHEQEKKPWGTSTNGSAKEYVDNYMMRMRLTCSLCDKLGSYFDFLNQDFEDVTAKMEATDVVVDFFDYATEDNDIQYQAFVFRKEDKAPHLIRICKESEVSDAYTEDWSVNTRLTDLLWTVISSSCDIKPNENVHFVPCGSLSVIPIESLKADAESGKTLEEIYSSFTRLSHVREMSGCKDRQNIKDITLFGGLNYGEGADTSTTDRGYKVGQHTYEPTELLPWGNLSGTEREVGQISFRSQMSGIHTVTFTGLQGTGDAFKALDGHSPTVIHLATHGFFETKDTALNLPALQGRVSPMDLSGLVMSNGNQGWLHGTPIHREGILTAADIAKMDLSDTSLVVLSACNSGSGAVRSDGVYGLQRAFKKAGATTILMSLWNESDEVGEMFMMSFYNYFLAGNYTKRQAFKLAKNEIKRHYPHPFFWANFVMLD